ncbi:MAG: trimeric intracellular cation channel family protein [Pseudomonadota bacterium]|nr:trimeric intracellular cation channel family protein [Pseudomonadota bacterium]
MTFLQLLDLAGVAVFAATGALAASRKQLDIIGFLFLAGLTGIGGGTVRDVVLGIDPVFWVASSSYIGVCAVVALAVYLAAPHVEYRYRLLLWLDAIGLSAYAVMGAARGLEAGAAPLVAIVAGMMTATLGGLMRDIVTGEPSVLLRREIYITAALAGASLFVLLASAGVDPAIAAGTAALGALVARGGALAFGWTLPGYRSRPGRPADEF